MKLPFYQSFAIMLSYLSVLVWFHQTMPAPCNHEQAPRFIPENIAAPDTMACDDFNLPPTCDFQIR